MGKIEKLSELEHGLKVLLLALLPFVLTVGVIAGTINLFIGGVLASSVVYQLSWSLVQALSIDVVFFTAIALVFKVPRWGKLPYAAIVLVYGYALYTSIQIAGLQELTHGNINTVMATLGVSTVAFTQLRSVAVLVTMIVLVPVQNAAKRYLTTGTHVERLNGTPVQVVEQAERNTPQIERPGTELYLVSHRVEQDGTAVERSGTLLIPQPLHAIPVEQVSGTVERNDGTERNGGTLEWNGGGTVERYTDEDLRRMKESGMTYSEMERITGIARSTLNRRINK